MQSLSCTVHHFHFPFSSLSGTRSLVPFVRSLSCQFTYECCTWWRSEESRLKLTFRISSWMNCVHMERTSINTRQTLLLSMPGEYMQMNSCVYSTSHYCNNWVSRLGISLYLAFKMLPDGKITAPKMLCQKVAAASELNMLWTAESILPRQFYTRLEMNDYAEWQKSAHTSRHNNNNNNTSPSTVKLLNDPHSLVHFSSLCSLAFSLSSSSSAYAENQQQQQQ